MKTRVKAEEMKIYLDLNLDPLTTFKKMGPSNVNRSKFLI